MKRIGKALAVVLFHVLFFAGCAGVSKQVPKLSEAAARDLVHQAVDFLKKRDASLQGLRGLASVRYGSNLFGVHGETAFAVRRPGQLRIDALSDFGSFASQVILSRGRLLIVWPSENTYFEGVADRGAMERFLSVGLEPDEMIDVLMGAVPLESEDRYRIVRADEKEIVVRGERRELWLERSEGRFLPIKIVGLDERGKMRYQAKYGHYRDHEGRLFPVKLSAEFWEPRSRIEIQFKDIELNPKVENKIFRQEIPANATPFEN